MSEMRIVGAAAAVVAVVMLSAGCGGGTGGEDAKASSSSSVSETSAEEVTEDPSPTYPPGPEGEIDQKGDEEGWTYDSLYASASDYVRDICDSLPDQTKNWSGAQWLAESGNMDGDGQAILMFGVPKLCPKWTSTVKDAVAGDYVRYISSGKYEVKTHPKPYSQDSDVQEIKPGTYVAVGHFSDCYWERSAADGSIIANQAVTQATRLSVTLRAGELFDNECGTFKPAG